MATVAAETGTSLWRIFTQKAELVGAVVMRTASQETAVALLRETTGGFICTSSAAARFPKLARRASRKKAADTPMAEVVAAGEFAVAETGSVAVNEPQLDRGKCFLAERLWVLVAEREILPTLDAGMQRMRDLVAKGARHPLLMTGPSRTADIERVLTIGVHGPRALCVVVVGDA
jgi:L-lactate dehydrogenase complex protein LldG